MKFSEEELERLKGVRDSFYRVLNGMDILKPAEDGTITAWGGRRLLWIDSETFAIPLEIIGPVHNRVMYDLGKDAGEAIAKGLAVERGPKEKIKILWKLFRRGGFGLVRDALKTEKREIPDVVFKCWGYAMYAGWVKDGMTYEMDPAAGKATFSEVNSFESYARKKRKSYGKPSCYFIAGTVAGLFNHWFKREDLGAKEVECIAIDDSRCFYIIQPGWGE